MSGIRPPEEWEKLPSYVDVCAGYVRYVGTFLEDLKKGDYVFPRDFVRDANQCFLPSFHDISIVVILAVIWTLARHLLTECLFKPLGRKLELVPRSLDKMPESAWKLIFYVFSWTYTAIIVLHRGFFQWPHTVWDDWTVDAPVPFDLYLLYAFQCSFYFHSLYTTAFVDTWRKDSPLLMVHHVATLILLICSHIAKCHNIGSLVVFFHDGCDVLLEFTKLQVYFKIQRGKLIKVHDVLSNVGFACFGIFWFISRLYWFPLKALHAGSTSLMEHNINLPFGVLTNTLLWLLAVMNVYWFMLIVALVLRVARGQIEELDDTREYDVLEKIENSLRTRKQSIQNGVSRDAQKNKKVQGVGFQENSSVVAGRELHTNCHARTRSVVFSNGSTGCAE